MSEYSARVPAYTAQADPIQMQREAATMIEELLAGRSEEELRMRPRPGKCSVIEILAHLADDELVSAWRYRQMIERSGCELSAFDQDQWARLGAHIVLGMRRMRLRCSVCFEKQTCACSPI